MKSTKLMILVLLWAGGAWARTNTILDSLGGSSVRASSYHTEAMASDSTNVGIDEGAFACHTGPFPFRNRFTYVCVNEKTGTPIWGVQDVRSFLFVEYLERYDNVADVQVSLNTRGNWKGRFFRNHRVLLISIWRDSFGAVWISLDGA